MLLLILLLIVGQNIIFVHLSDALIDSLYKFCEMEQT